MRRPDPPWNPDRRGSLTLDSVCYPDVNVRCRSTSDANRNATKSGGPCQGASRDLFAGPLQKAGIATELRVTCGSARPRWLRAKSKPQNLTIDLTTR